ncbi:hypothetical protein HK102_010981 [Quaeritorhiza haematococci]|nr:hypothetical protein HK102_010981 [Quaeritorhiza haematococci]
MEEFELTQELVGSLKGQLLPNFWKSLKKRADLSEPSRKRFKAGGGAGKNGWFLADEQRLGTTIREVIEGLQTPLFYNTKNSSVSDGGEIGGDSRVHDGLEVQSSGAAASENTQSANVHSEQDGVQGQPQAGEQAQE